MQSSDCHQRDGSERRQQVRAVLLSPDSRLGRQLDELLSVFLEVVCKIFLPTLRRECGL